MATGLKLWRVSGDKLFSCNPTRDFSAWENGEHQHKCERFHELLSGECDCGTHAWTSMEALLVYLCVNIEKAQITGIRHLIDYKFVIGIVSADLPTVTEYGWKSDSVLIEKILPISWDRWDQPHAQVQFDIHSGIHIFFNGDYTYTYRKGSEEKKRPFVKNGIEELAKFLPDADEIERLQESYRDSLGSDSLLKDKRLFDSVSAEIAFRQRPGLHLYRSDQQVIAQTDMNNFCFLRDSIANQTLARPSQDSIRKDFRRPQAGKGKHAVLGFRAWNVFWYTGDPNPRLMSLTEAGGRKTFSPGIQTAGCRSCSSPPARRHHCGFNAFSSLEGLFDSGYLREASQKNSVWDNNQIIGSVAGFGKTRVHKTHGWRSEKIKLLALLVTRDTTRYDEHFQAAQKLAEEHEVPLFADPILFEEYSLTQATLDYLETPVLIGADRSI